ncbi:MAG: hypothetical protein BWY35_00138 [Firmicutes bacterium ADurb.Bin248]|nr:MAG: hypothetical protein BWY35_00138 [Firmicutes bacterium ADurb.Bin248]
MKRQILIALALLAAFAALVSGCKPASPAPTATPPAVTTAPPMETLAPATPSPTPVQSGLAGDTKDILAAVNEGANIDFETFDEQITAETCQSYLGLTPEQLSEYAEDAYVSMAAMNVSAHLTALVKCKDAASAAEVKSLVAKGFDSGRWVCVRPDRCLVVEAGSYVFLIASYDEIATALEDAFRALAGDAAGEADVFFEAE